MDDIFRRAALILCDYSPADDAMSVLDLAGADLREPFFVQSMAKSLEGSPRPLEIAGDRSRVAELVAGQRSLPVAGQIFHTGRCGSTLVSNALSALGDVLILKEPLFLSSISAEVLGVPAGGAGELAARVTGLLRNTVPATRAAQRCSVFKYTSWNVLGEAFWAGVLAGCPKVFVWRSCAEVVESIAVAPAEWAVGRDRAVSVTAFGEGRDLLREHGIRLPEPLQTGAAAWLCTARKGVELAEQGALVVSYQQLLADLPDAMTRICAHFRFPVNRERVERACEVRRFHAKDPRGEREFTAPRREDLLGAELRGTLQRVAGDLEDSLITVHRTEARSFGTPPRPSGGNEPCPGP